MRKPTALSSNAANRTTGTPLDPVGPTVRWSRVAPALVELAGATRGDATAWSAFERLAAGLLEPVRLLEALARSATPALAGESQARERFAAQLRQVGRSIGTIGRDAPTERTAPPSTANSQGCCCAPADRNAAQRRPVVYRDGGEAEPRTMPSAPASAAGEFFDESALTTVLVAAAACAMDVGVDDLSVEEATNTVAMLALDAGLLAGLVRGHDEAGLSGLLTALEDARSGGRLQWAAWAGPGAIAPPVMNTLGGGAPAGFDMPGVPGVPDLPGFPGGFGRPGDPVFPDTLEERIGKILQELVKPKKWDTETLDHVYPFWLEAVTYHDPYDLYNLRCFREANHLLLALAEPQPTPPAVPVWNTGIVSVALTSPCAGDKITILGSGFGATQPGNTVLLLPTLDGCRVVAPTSWSDNKIVAVLPVRVSSGPVGFGDAAYVVAYDAWAARMNQLEQQLARLRCAPRPMRLVAPFGQCPPASAINVITAGTAEIVAFTANDQVVHVLAPGGPLTLRWTVKNATTVQLVRTSPSGAPFGVSTTLTPAPGQTSHAFGPQNHTSIGEWTYRITVTGVCGTPTSRNVTVVTARTPGLSVAQTQITQSIQTPDHAVKLVAFKPTVLRALVKHGIGTWGGGIVPNVIGRARMLRGGVWSAWIDAANNTDPMTPTPGTSITVPVLPALDNTNDTLNFILPPDWCWGKVSYQVEVRVSGFAATPSFAGFSEQTVKGTVSVTYENRRVLQFRYIRVNWNGMGAPTAAVCVDTIAAAIPLLPTASAGIGPVPGQGVHNRSSSSTDQENAQRRDMLDDFEDEHNCSTFEAAFEWLGFDCPDDDGAIWVLIPGQFRRGEAYAIPSNVCFTPPSDGPYAAHEISHCLNQQHVRLPVVGGPDGGDAPSAWPNNAMLTDVPFDSRGSQTGAGTAPRALSLTAGKGVADVMTYWGTPNNTWPMPKRWQQLWDFIGP